MCSSSLFPVPLPKTSQILLILSFPPMVSLSPPLGSSLPSWHRSAGCPIPQSAKSLCPLPEALCWAPRPTGSWVWDWCHAKEGASLHSLLCPLLPSVFHGMLLLQIVRQAFESNEEGCPKTDHNTSRSLQGLPLAQTNFNT